MSKTLIQEELRKLIPQAFEVMRRAYAPYSNFQVGAALLGKSGTIYLGCNVENASYGLAICAERAAVAKAVSEGEQSFQGIVVVTRCSKPGPPCGMCRQVLAEFDPQMPVLMVTMQGDELMMTVEELLPLTFTKDYL